MNFRKSIFVLMMVVLAPASAIAEYSGTGGMTEYDIKPEAYEYHYKNGFTGVDALGWDANLQYAWSRAGAAVTCKIKMDKDLVLKNMSEKYGNDPFVHDLNGVGFHHLQSKKIENFCTKERVAEITEVIPKLEAGNFPQKY